MNFYILTVKGGGPTSRHSFPCMLSNLPDGGQKTAEKCKITMECIAFVVAPCINNIKHFIVQLM